MNLTSLKEMYKTGIIIQARTSSTRLPRKILKELPYGSGITVLEQVIKRCKLSKLAGEIIIATTKDKEDAEIVKVAENEGVGHFRGDRDDVLSRYYLSARENNLDVIVRITSDCPCIDPEIVDLVIQRHVNEKADYTSNALIFTYPQGLDVEVFNFNVLKKAYESAKKDYEKEHVTPYIYENQNIFKCLSIEASREHYAPDIRITIDTEEDYALLCLVFDCLYSKNKYFAALDIIRLFAEKPWLKLINKNIVQKKIFNSLNDEINEAIKILDLQDLSRAKGLLKTLLT